MASSQKAVFEGFRSIAFNRPLLREDNGDTADVEFLPSSKQVSPLPYRTADHTVKVE